MLLCVGLLLWLNLASAAKLGQVQTEGGRVQGVSHRMGLFRSVDVFKGIPFAAPPGKWEKPKPHPGWDGVLKASKYGPRCLQVNLLQMKTIGSEDCLFLNVFVPQGRKLSSNLPVMVYLFGGAFLLGASNEVELLGHSLYDGREMADRGDVIIVTLNYRVGTMGFLSTGDSRLPGNYGLWDQHFAIAWVKRNIAAFGGNPDNMTIFGQSAGAASVSYQMLSPHNKGMFRRAISQSGTALCPWALQNNPLALTKKIARKVGCWRTNVDLMIECLKMSDPVGLTMAGKIDILLILGKGTVMDMLELAPVVDGDFLPDLPQNLFPNAGRFDYMAGVNSMDGHFFAGVDVPNINIRNVTTVEQVKGLLTGLTKDKGTAAVGGAFAAYSAHWGSHPEPAVVKKTVADIETDFLFLVPTQTALQLHANHATLWEDLTWESMGGFNMGAYETDFLFLVPTQTALQLHANHATGTRTYSYLFNMETRIPGFPRWVEAEHAEELQYLFGKPFSLPLIYFPRHRDLAQYMIAYWTNFARTGDPNKGESRVPVVWPAFTKNHRPYLTINNKIKKSSVGYDLRSDLVSYWTQNYSLLPSVRSKSE